MSNLYQSYDILGYVLFIDFGVSYYILCNGCCELLIQDIEDKRRSLLKYLFLLTPKMKMYMNTVKYQ